MSIPSTDHSTGKSQQLDVEEESVKQALHRLDQYQPTFMMALPPCPPTEEIFQPSMAIEQATKIQPSIANRKPQICITRIFIFALLYSFPHLSKPPTSHFVMICLSFLNKIKMSSLFSHLHCLLQYQHISSWSIKLFLPKNLLACSALPLSSLIVCADVNL